jgi:opacity protein-like surface antigen
MRRSYWLILAALVGVTGTAAGQGRAEFALGGGLTEPMGDFGDAAKVGWHALGTITWFPSRDVFGLQATAFYGQNKFDPGGGKFQMFGALGEVRLNLRTEGAFRPYVMAGPGFMDVETKPTGGSSSTDTKFALSGGIGFGYMGAGKVGFFVQARYVNVFYSGPDLTFSPVSAGLLISLH